MSVQRRLSARRGSTTAPDPFGVHSDVNLNPNRSSSSRLTIVRVPAAATAPAPLSLNEPPPSPVLGQRRLHRRVAPPVGAPDRVSFAFSSFDRSSSPDHAVSSPSSSPRLRPSSPHSNPYASKPRLTPDQLVSLARNSTVPHTAHDPAHPAPATFTPLPDDIYLPFIDRPAEVSALISTPPDLKLFSLLAQTFPKKPSPPAEATTHIDLPRDPAQWTYPHLLFHLTHIDRDVAPDFIWAIAARKSILSHSELLWERIKGALGIPPELDVDYNFLDDDQESPDTSDISDDEGRGAKGHWSDWDEVVDSPIQTRKRLSMGESPAASLYSGRRDEHDPGSASFRAQMDNRLAGLQGGFTQSSSTTNDNGDDAGGAGDTTTIAPTPHPAPSPPHHEHEHDRNVGGMVIGNFSPPIISEPPASEYLSIQPLLAPSSAATSPGLLFNSLSSSTGSAGSVGSGSAPAPGDALGLGDIAEGAEEEEEEGNEADVESATSLAASGAGGEEKGTESGLDDPDLISPSQIQGLRISTSPLPLPASNSSTSLSHVSGTTPVLSPISPLPPYPSSSASNAPQTHGMPSSTSYSYAVNASNAYTSPSSQPHSRRSSFGSVGPFQRSESTGNLSASWSAMAAAAAASAGGGIYGAQANVSHPNYPAQSQGHGNTGSTYAASIVGSDAGDSTGYISDGDVRSAYGGGQPLFVSNFARLAGGPTLRANTSSSKRASNHIPHARYAVDSLALHMRNSSTGSGSGAQSALGTGKKARTYSHGANTGTTTGGGASLGRVASLGGGGGGGGLLSSSSSSSSVSGGYANPNRKSWGETKQAQVAAKE